MAFDDKTRNRLQTFVNESRDLLTEEFTRQLQYEYGMDPGSGRISPLENLSHLDDHHRETAQLLRDMLIHYQSTTPASEAAELIKRIVREQAFTVLNRFCAIRMAEARGVSIECIGNGFNSKGFQLYSLLAGTSLGETGEAYRYFLYGVFDEFASDLPILFDRYSTTGRLFPKESILLELLAKINHSDLLPLWSEDETIGWIYQYFNIESERRAMREHGAPRNSRELAVRNQFFTPRYVVEFLTDNTLGRTWYEMCKGQTRLVNECQYMVVRKNPVFLDKGQDLPKPLDTVTSEDPREEGLLPEYVRFRAKKDPRDLRILDPACGSGHFLLYAFDLLETIYEESWEDSEAPLFGETNGSLRDNYPTMEELNNAIPGLILRWNLHGVDIDPRASQIAALALWLRAQRSYQNLGLKGVNRPQITKSNIVTAEPMPGEEDILEEFCSGIRQNTIANIVREIFDKMKIAGVAGSLLKVEEDIRGLICQAQAERRAELENAKDNKGNDLLFTQAEIDDLAGMKQLRLFDSADATDDEFWPEAEKLVVNTLRAYAEKAVNGCVTSRKLFADDAERGFAFIDLFQKPFDVVLMNPPFGEASGQTHAYLETHYPSWNDNILCAFLQRAWEITAPSGAVGAVYDRTALVKITYENFRRDILLPDSRFAAMADLGWGVLDANVEVTTSVLRHRFSGYGVFVDARSYATMCKQDKIQVALRDLAEGKKPIDLVLKKTVSFLSLPNAVIGYDFPDYLVRAFMDLPSLQKAGFKAGVGYQLKAERFFRLIWEVNSPQNVQFFSRMFNGAGFRPYVTSYISCAIAPMEVRELLYDHSTRLQNVEMQKKPGVCFGVRGEFLCAHVLPAEHIFTVEGQAIPTTSLASALELMAFMNTPLVRYSLNRYCGQHKYSGYVNLMPYKAFDQPASITYMILESIIKNFSAQRFDELQSVFCIPPSISTIESYAKSIMGAIDDAWEAVDTSELSCHVSIMRIYCVNQAEKELLDEYRAHQPHPESPVEDADIETGCVWIAAHTVISYALGLIFGRWDIGFAIGDKKPIEITDPFLLLPIYSPGMLKDAQGMPAKQEDIGPDYPLRVSWSGIIVDDKGHPDDIEARICGAIGIIYGESRDAIEQEACDILGCRSLRSYFEKPSGFFADHLKRYSKRRRQAPIYWPLSTASGSYTLWIYCHRITNQTLYSCVNDYVDIKQKQVSEDVSKLRSKQNRSTGDEKEMERLSSVGSELKDFRDELLRVAAFWKPDLNDGVQITAAPLWQLFRFPKWRNALKETWENLAKGEYDWAHLALEIWPDRVREKCRHDKSLAIAHDLEELYEEPPTVKMKRGRAKKVTSEGEE